MNNRVFQMVLLFLGLALILCIGGVIGLSIADKPVDDILKQGITGIVTGLIGLLVRSPLDPADTQNVNVTNKAVPVTDADV